MAFVLVRFRDCMLSRMRNFKNRLKGAYSACFMVKRVLDKPVLLVACSQRVSGHVRSEKISV